MAPNVYIYDHIEKANVSNMGKHKVWNNCLVEIFLNQIYNVFLLISYNLLACTGLFASGIQPMM